MRNLLCGVGIAILLMSGCTEAKQNVGATVITDEMIRQAVPGSWFTDDNAGKDDRPGDGKGREITVWTFRPDGTWSNGIGNNSPTTGNTLLIMGLEALGGTGASGKWWVQNGNLQVELLEMQNPISSAIMNGRNGIMPWRSGKVILKRINIEDREYDVLLAGNCPYFRTVAKQFHP